MSERRQVLARYSILKTGAWILGVGALSISTLAKGWANGWRAPPDTVVPSAYILGYGAAPFALVIVVALAELLILRQGVAIEKFGGEIVLNFPFRRKRISLSRSVAVDATARRVQTPGQEAANWRAAASWEKPQRVFVSQVTFFRLGEADINFPSALLTEEAGVVAQRISQAISETAT